MNILFIGCVQSSYILLKNLLENNFNICGVVTKRKSNFNSDYRDLTFLCQQYGIECFYADDHDDIYQYNFIKSKKPDLIYCFGWSHLLKKDILDIPRLGTVGFHPAKLPNNKGRHPIIWALVLGLEETASTFFMIDENADNGDIVSQEGLLIDVDDDASTLYEKIMAVSSRQVVALTNQFLNGSVKYTKQNKGNIWRKRTKKDGEIDFRMSAKTIYNLVRGLTHPYVGAHFVYKDTEYKVWKSEVVEDEFEFINQEFGKIIDVYSKESFLVKTGEGLLKVINCDSIELKKGDYL